MPEIRDRVRMWWRTFFGTHPVFASRATLQQLADLRADNDRLRADLDTTRTNNRILGDEVQRWVTRVSRLEGSENRGGAAANSTTPTSAEQYAEIEALRVDRDQWKELSERFRSMTPWADEFNEGFPP